MTLATRRGTATCAREVTRDIREDTVFVPFHWGGAQLDQPPDQPRARSDQPHAGVQGVRRPHRAAVRTPRSEERMKQVESDMFAGPDSSDSS